MNRRIFSLFIILSTVFVQDASTAPAYPAGTWQPGAFKIHIFDIETMKIIAEMPEGE